MTFTPQNQPRRPSGNHDGGQFASAPHPAQVDAPLSLAVEKIADRGQPMSSARSAALKKYDEALGYMFVWYPYYGRVLSGLSPVWGGTQTLAVDFKGRLFMNEHFVNRLDNLEMAGVLAHEVNHLLRGHNDRAGDRHHKPWNRACDRPINHDLREAGFLLPEGVLYPEQIGMEPGQMEETYYEREVELMEEEQQQQQQQQSDEGEEGDSEEGDGEGQGQGSPGDSDGDQDSQGGSGSDSSDESEDGNSGSQPGADDSSGSGSTESDDSENAGGGGDASDGSDGADGNSSDDGVMGGDCGSCAGGWGRESEEMEQAAEEAGEDGLSDQEVDRIRRQTARDVEEYASKSQGHKLGGLKSWAEKINNPTLDWRTVFKRRVGTFIHKAKAGTPRKTHAKPSRRAQVIKRGAKQPHIILPGTRRYAPELALVIDTSGSMGAEDTAAALGEASGIIDQMGVSVNLICCDAAASKAVRIHNVHSRIELEGGGGTDMSVGIAEAMKADPQPDYIVVLTDGYTPWPKTKPKAAVFVGLIHPKDSPPSNPPHWAETVHIHTDARR